MHKIYFYRDRNGRQPVKEYMDDLAARADKDSRVKATKIRDYVKALSAYGLQLGQPYIKHLEGDLWELRPLRDRIFFVAWTGGSFVLLHQFMKDTQKTPRREIEQAKRELADLKERGIDDGK